jgi:hypothetical protein
VNKGKTPVLAAGEARSLLDAIEHEQPHRPPRSRAYRRHGVQLRTRQCRSCR